MRTLDDRPHPTAPLDDSLLADFVKKPSAEGVTKHTFKRRYPPPGG